jgi:uncharacterized membrane protein
MTNRLSMRGRLSVAVVALGLALASSGFAVSTAHAAPPVCNWHYIYGDC